MVVFLDWWIGKRTWFFGLALGGVPRIALLSEQKGCRGAKEAQKA
ncbi:MAG: hypothetical protein PUP91_12440 [Rhizonema sp. PD37]|nr:hypothetical protein [Rhizonema sp. PD37]